MSVTELYGFYLKWNKNRPTINEKTHEMTYRRKLSDIAGRAESSTVLSGTALSQS